MACRTLRSLALLLPVLVAFPALADSPLTSTPIWYAYADEYAMVTHATEEGMMTEEIAEYLASEGVPIDVKAAVISALGWDTEPQTMAEEYCAFVYPDADGIPAPSDLSGEEALVIGYLQAMDDYFHPENALPMLAHARSEMPESLTVAVLHTLCEAQRLFDEVDDWYELWHMTALVIYDRELTGDMRVGAIRIIEDYMSLYAEE
jgi:hypothetical protein